MPASLPPRSSHPARPAALAASALLVLTGVFAPPTWAADSRPWVASWETAPSGTFRNGTTPALVNLAFPNAATEGANEQTLRMIIKPDLWSKKMRLRFSNAYGTQPITFGAVKVGVQAFSGNLVAGTNTAVTFNGGQAGVTIPGGEDLYSDEFKLPIVAADPLINGKNLAVSMYVRGTTGPMTFHGTALTESFLGAPGSGDHTGDGDDFAFPYETSSFFFVTGLDVRAAADTRVLVVAGSSSADGSITTPDANDRFLNWMSRRLHAAYGNKVSVVNAGIGGDTAATPGPGETRALPQHLPERFNRDVLTVSGVTDVLFYAGTNDFGDKIPVGESTASLANLVGQLHARGIHAIGSTLISNVGQAGTTQATYDAHNAINDFILHSGTFDSTADFYGATVDPATQILLPQYSTHSDPNGTPDFLHLGRAGAEAEAFTLDVSFFGR